jgi:carboxypeptidase C (cathepsin A)
VGTYLGRPEVRAALGVGTRKWTDCNKAVAIEFELAGDWMHDYQTMIPDQLDAGIRVLIYAGDQVRVWEGARGGGGVRRRQTGAGAWCCFVFGVSEQLSSLTHK